MSAYFQLSSLPMMFAVLFWLMSILALINHPKKLFGSHLLSAICFVASVLSYEQILPLLIVNLVVAITRVEDFKVRLNSYSSFYSLSISAFCALFLFFYFGNQNNPKVVTVKFENSVIEQQLSQESHSVNTKAPLDWVELLSFKMNILAQKTAKTVNFIKGSLFTVSQLIRTWLV